MSDTELVEIYVLRETDSKNEFHDDTFTIHLSVGRKNIPTELVIEEDERHWNCYLIRLLDVVTFPDGLDKYKCVYKQF